MVEGQTGGDSPADTVLAILTAAGEPMRTGDIERAVQGRYVDRTVRQALRTLVDTGQVAKLGHGVYGLSEDG